MVPTLLTQLRQFEMFSKWQINHATTAWENGLFANYLKKFRRKNFIILGTKYVRHSGRRDENCTGAT